MCWYRHLLGIIFANKAYTVQESFLLSYLAISTSYPRLWCLFYLMKLFWTRDTILFLQACLIILCLFKAFIVMDQPILLIIGKKI
jgi:hypothetical protein